MKPLNLLGLGAIGVGVMGALMGEAAYASSHSDAPLIKQDPQANLTDVYAFVGRKYNDPRETVLNIIANVRPFSEPGDGPHYERFADDARYSLHITDPASGTTLIRYDFAFSDVDGPHKNLNTILSYGNGTAVGPLNILDGPTQNYAQRYSVTRVLGDDEYTDVIGTNLIVAPPNVGLNTTPFYNDAKGQAVSGAPDFSSLDTYTQQAIQELGTGETVFAGPRDDSFFADIPGVFDLLNVRILDNNGSLADGLGLDGNGVDGFKGFNILSFALQIPISGLPAFPYESALFGSQMGVGVYASVSRPKFRELNTDGNDTTSGEMIQVNRLGNPLFNEGLVALADKDNFNRTSPTGDVQFGTYAENSELAALINFVFGTSFVETGRTDLLNIFIPDVLRVNTGTGPVTLSGQPGFSRLGFIGGDTTGGVSSGWPNGRRMGDDVVDVALTAIASGPTYTEITVVGDNVPANDIAYNQVFPYTGTPHSGTFNRKDPTGVTGDINGDGVVNILDLLLVLGNFGQGG